MSWNAYRSIPTLCSWRTRFWCLMEVPSLAAAIAPYRETAALPAPATVDGGDLIVLGRTVLAGVTTRTSPAGAEALGAVLAQYGYTVRPVPVTGVLHLKSAATAADETTLVAHTPYVDLHGIDAKVIEVHPDEPQAANVVPVDGRLLVDATGPRTAAILEAHGFQVVPVDVSEFAKAEGALSCKSVIFTR